jgi:transposase
MQEENLSHQKWVIGPSPLIDDVLQRLHFTEILSGFVRNERYVKALKVVVRSILMAPAALYRIPEWHLLFEPKEFPLLKLDDDVIGRALDALFACDRATLQTQLTVSTIKEFNVDTNAIHNDSTSIKLHGSYHTQSSRAIKLKRGHSKDHRPDLKQLVYNLSVTEDGAIPVHFKCFDGNRTDDTIHIETWLTLRGVLGRSDFLYVADSKLCTSENMSKIDNEGGKFVTIVPDSRRETAEFAKLCFDSEIRWVPLTRRKVSGKKNTVDSFDIAEGCFQLREGFKIFWYRSSEKRRRDAESRKERLDKAIEKLSQLSTEGRRGPKSKKALLQRAKDILQRYSVAGLIDVEVQVETIEVFKKLTRGKPTEDSNYKRIVKEQPFLVFQKNTEAISQSETLDGIIPLTTNTKLSPKQALSAYKYQPYLERRFSCMKSDYEIAPVFLKRNDRIEALMFACYVADLVAAIIQRQLRNAMKANDIKQLQILPEERPSETPTWEQVQRLFANHAKYQLSRDNQLVKTFWDPLTKHQQQVLTLLEIPLSEYSG